jgi:hypothetical protein
MSLIAIEKKSTDIDYTCSECLKIIEHDYTARETCQKTIINTNNGCSVLTVKCNTAKKILMLAYKIAVTLLLIYTMKLSFANYGHFKLIVSVVFISICVRSIILTATFRSVVLDNDNITLDRYLLKPKKIPYIESSYKKILWIVALIKRDKSNFIANYAITIELNIVNATNKLEIMQHLSRVSNRNIFEIYKPITSITMFVKEK